LYPRAKQISNSLQATSSAAESAYYHKRKQRMIVRSSADEGSQHRKTSFFCGAHCDFLSNSRPLLKELSWVVGASRMEALDYPPRVVRLLPVALPGDSFWVTWV
jgi:hypothetical protein